jgi:CheY-like chemotaxis protein
MLAAAVAAARTGDAARERGPKPAAAQRLTGLHLLVAEDNPTNQQVIRELLVLEGATVRIAHDGAQAIAALAQDDAPFDLVLMDLQMPVMDGLTATRIIRRDTGLQALPIVAMTANAMSSDRQACLDAGMNDHVGKPFDLDDLVRVLRRHTGRAAAPAQTPGRFEIRLSSLQTEAAAAAGIELTSALVRLAGDGVTYTRMLELFVNDLQRMDQRLQAAPLDEARLQLHTLRGLAATIGAPTLSAAAADAEKELAGQPSGSTLAQALQPVCAAVRAATPGLAALLQTLQADAPAGPDQPLLLRHQVLVSRLSALAELLAHSDMAAIDLMAELQRQFGADGNGLLGPLSQAITALDFELAGKLCRRLMQQLST